MCKMKDRRSRETDSLLSNASLPKWLYTSFPFIALFAGLGCLFLVDPNGFTVTLGVCLVLYSLVIFYLRIAHKNKNKK